MKHVSYNDMEFIIEKVGAAWAIKRGEALVAAGLFSGLPEAEAENKAVELIKTVHPVGIKVVGPDVAHPLRIGDMIYVGPDIAHPNFISWNKDSSSFPTQAGVGLPKG